MLTRADLDKLREKARELGFSRLEALPAMPADSIYRRFLRGWIRSGKSGSAPYLQRTLERFLPQRLFAPVKTILVLSFPYVHEETLKALEKSPFKIARYAWGRDYHRTLKSKLKKLSAGLSVSRALTDSSPLSERYLARRAGLGFIGKNGMLIDPKSGSFFLLAFLLLSDDLESGAEFTRADPMEDMKFFCGDCDRCVRACPTAALDGSSLVDVRLCLSHWTIEDNENPLPPPGKKHRWIFGCDICQTVCPYNSGVILTSDPDFAPRSSTLTVASGNLEILEEEDLFGSPLARAGLKQLRRNRDTLK